MKKSREKKYYNPQTKKERVCDHKGCKKLGEYKAPKDSTLKEYYWFCLDHVREYNSEWDYYSDMNESEVEEENKKDRYWGNTTSRYGTSPNGASAKTKSKIKYAFGYKIRDAFDFFEDDEVFKSSNVASGYFTREEREYMKILELKVSHRDVAGLKKQYKILVKQYHPDLNPGDEKAETMFKKVAAAYAELLDLWA